MIWSGKGKQQKRTFSGSLWLCRQTLLRKSCKSSSTAEVFWCVFLGRSTRKSNVWMKTDSEALTIVFTVRSDRKISDGYNPHGIYLYLVSETRYFLWLATDKFWVTLFACDLSLSCLEDWVALEQHLTRWWARGTMGHVLLLLVSLVQSLFGGLTVKFFQCNDCNNFFNVPAK